MPEKTRLEMWLNSSVMTALVGVIGTALLGAWVSGIIQQRNKDNELDRRAQEMRLDSQNVAVGKVLERAGGFLSATDDLLVTVNNAYAEAGRADAEAEALRKWKMQLRERRDTAESDWRRDKRSLGFTLQYLFDGDRGIADAWRGVLAAEDGFEGCTNKWYTQNAALGTNLTPNGICQSERAKFEQAVESFTAAVGAARSRIAS